VSEHVLIVRIRIRSPGIARGSDFSSGMALPLGKAAAVRRIMSPAAHFGFGWFIMNEKVHLSLTREELYTLAWAKPMTQVARDFGISDRALAKICARRQVPVPPRGYWARKSAGRKVHQLPLPAFAVKETKVKSKPAPPVAKKPKPHSIFDERNRTIRRALKGFRQALDEAIDYSVRIDGWNCDYSFGLSPSYDPLHRNDVMSFIHDSPFVEERDLVLRGVFLKPAKLRERKFEARLVRQQHLNQSEVEKVQHRYQESPPKCVGGFSRQDQSILGILAIPDDAFAVVLQNVVAHKTRFMNLRGEKLSYGRGDIYHYSLHEEHEG